MHILHLIGNFTRNAKRVKMLPTCLGGCPNKRLDGNVECNHIKFGMQEYLVRCTEAFLSRNPAGFQSTCVIILIVRLILKLSV